MKDMEKNDLRKRRLWTEEEDKKLREYVCRNGARLWDTVARDLGLGRSGNSCRLRWVNYLSFIRRGKMTDEEMLRILTLQSEFGNKWAKIARRLPGRTDNDIKNLWYTRVKREANKFNCVVGSKEFLEKFPDRIQATAGVAAEPPFTTTVEDAFTLPALATAGGGATTVLAKAHPLTTAADYALITPMFSSPASAGSSESPSFTKTDYDVFMESLPPLAALGGGSATAWWF